MLQDGAGADRILRPYDRDRWSKGWTLGAGIGLLVSFVLPDGHGYTVSLMDGVGYVWWWYWSWEKLQGDQIDRFSVLTPLVLGLGSLFIAWRLAGPRRGIALLVLSLALLGVDQALSWLDRGPPWLWDASLGALAPSTERMVAVLVACIVIAAGNHLQRHDLGNRSAQLACGFGGGLLLVGLLVPTRDEGTFPYVKMWGDVFGAPWVYWPLAAGVLLYGVLAAPSLSPRPIAARWRRVWLGRLGRLLLIGQVVGRVQSAWSPDALHHNWAVPLLKQALAFDARLVLCAVGLASLLEAKWLPGRAPPLGATTTGTA